MTTFGSVRRLILCSNSERKHQSYTFLSYSTTRLNCSPPTTFQKHPNPHRILQSNAKVSALTNYLPRNHSLSKPTKIIPRTLFPLPSAPIPRRKRHNFYSKGNPPSGISKLDLKPSSCPKKIYKFRIPSQKKQLIAIIPINPKHKPNPPANYHHNKFLI